MGGHSKSLNLLVRESLLAVRELATRSHLAKAWEMLQERDREGNPKGPLPYTDEALEEFRLAHEAYPQDLGIIHHLAIGHHARAWDRELAGAPGAFDDWKRALGYWHMLAAGDFWSGLKQKLKAIDPQADAAVIDEARRNLDEDLLNVHVDFVRYYCELGRGERAAAHVEIVRRATIPPAVKMRLIERVYAAMTGSVAEAVGLGAYESALAPIEQFLGLFPEAAYLPALRRHAEICKAWLSRLSHKDNWDEILELAGRAEGPVTALSEHGDLPSQPLAKLAVDELTGEMARRGCDRGRAGLAALQAGTGGSHERDAAHEGFEFAIKWAKIGYEWGRTDSAVRQALPLALHDRGYCSYIGANEVMESDVDSRTKYASAAKLLGAAVAYLEEALACRPDDETIASNLKTLRDEYSRLEMLARRASLDI